MISAKQLLEIKHLINLKEICKLAEISYPNLMQRLSRQSELRVDESKRITKVLNSIKKTLIEAEKEENESTEVFP